MKDKFKRLEKNGGEVGSRRIGRPWTVALFAII